MVSFPKKKKLESVNILANDIRNFLKGFKFCGSAKNYFHLKRFFISKRE